MLPSQVWIFSFGTSIRATRFFRRRRWSRTRSASCVDFGTSNDACFQKRVLVVSKRMSFLFSRYRMSREHAATRLGRALRPVEALARSLVEDPGAFGS